MKKLLKACLALAMAASLVACGGEKATKFAKVGLGTVSSQKEDGQVNTTIAVVGLDADGKIQYLDLDVAQSNPLNAEPKTQTKKELQDAYGMKVASPIQKEWFEQAKFLEDFCLGKTAGEVAAIETKVKDDHHQNVPAGADLSAGCTMDIGDFKAAIAKACANAVDAKAEKIGVGEVMSASAAKTQLNTTIAVVATDAAGKVVKALLDVAQIYPGVTSTKAELKDDYGMKKVSPIQKEWFEQAAALETYLEGKTASEIAAIETKVKDDNHQNVPAGADLSAVCSMDIGAFKEAVAEALK